RKLARAIALHDLARRCGATVLHVAGYVAAVVDRRVGAAFRIHCIETAKLQQDVWKLMPGIHRHRVIGRRRNRVRLAVEGVRFIAPEAVHPSHLATDRVTPRDCREPQHVIERSIFQHQYEYVLNGTSGHKNLSGSSLSRRGWRHVEMPGSKVIYQNTAVLVRKEGCPS